MHGGLSPELTSMEQIKRVIRPTDVPDTGIANYNELIIFFQNHLFLIE